MRQDIKHKIVEFRSSRGSSSYQRRNNVDVFFAPSRESMTPNHKHRHRYCALNYTFVDRLVRSHIGKNYDRMYSDLKRLCSKNRWQDRKVARHVQSLVNVDEPIIDINGRKLLERGRRFSSGMCELYDGELYVDEHRIIREYKAHRLSAHERKLKARSKAITCEFIADGKWFKKINDVWFIADVVRQSIVYKKHGTVHEMKYDSEGKLISLALPRMYIVFSHRYHAFCESHVDWMSNADVYGRVFDLDHDQHVPFRFNMANSIIAINKRSCPSWLIKMYCGE